MTCTVEGSDADSCAPANGRPSWGPMAEPAAGAGVHNAAGWPTGRRTCLATAAAAVAALALPKPADAALTLERPQLFEQVGSAAALLPENALISTVNSAACHHPVLYLCFKLCSLRRPHTVRQHTIAAVLFCSSSHSPNELQSLPAGLQPPRLGTLQQQVDRYWAAVQDCCTDLDKYQVGVGRRSEAHLWLSAVLVWLPLCSQFSSTSNIGHIGVALLQRGG